LVLNVDANGRPGVEEVVQSGVIQFSLVASFLLDLLVTEAICEKVISTTENPFPKSQLTAADNASGPDHKCFNALVQGHKAMRVSLLLFISGLGLRPALREMTMSFTDSFLAS
jgi:hypothetical protein